MPSKDFTSNQIRVTKLIASGGLSGGGAQAGNNIGIAIYSASDASDVAGGIADSSMLDKVGKDVFMFISGSTTPKGKDHIEGSITLIGGDLHVSGALTTTGILSGAIPPASILGSANRIPFYNNAAPHSLTSDSQFKYFHTTTNKGFLMGGPSSIVASNAAKLSVAAELGVDCQGQNDPSKYALMVNGFKDDGGGGVSLVDTEGGVGLGFSRNYTDVGASIVHDSYASSTGDYSRGSLKFFNKNNNTDGGVQAQCFEIVGSHNGLVRATAGLSIDGGLMGGMFNVGDPTMASVGSGTRHLEFDKRTMQAKGDEWVPMVETHTGVKTLNTLYIHPYGGHVSIGYDGITRRPLPNSMLRVASASIYETSVNTNRYVADFRHTTWNGDSSGSPNPGDAQHGGIRIQCGQYAASADDSALWINFFDGDGTGGSLGRIAMKNGVGAFLWNSSDERIKADIKPTSVNALSLLNKINLKSFKKVHKSGITGSANPIGFVAQDVESSIPELVSDYNDEAYDFKVKSLGYSGFVPYLVKAVQELSAENDALKARIEALEN